MNSNVHRKGGPKLRLIILAPARIVCIIASDNSSSVVFRTNKRFEIRVCKSSLFVSLNTGYMSNLQLGHIAGAFVPLIAASIPKTKVPCMHATLLAFLQMLVWLLLTVLI